MDYNIILSLILVIFSCLIYSFFYKHILLTLISLEFLMLSIFFFLYNVFMLLNMNMLFLFLYLVVMISESVLGVSILIFMVRKNGNDYYKMLNLLAW